MHGKLRMLKHSIYNTCFCPSNNHVSLHNVDRYLRESVKIRISSRVSFDQLLSFQYGKMPRIYKRREDSIINSHAPNIHLKNYQLPDNIVLSLHPTPMYYLEANRRYPIILSINILAFISLKYRFFKNTMP